MSVFTGPTTWTQGVGDGHQQSEIWHADGTKAPFRADVMSGRKGRRGFGRIRKLPSGRWQASYMAPDLRRTNAPITFLTKADAEGWLGVERQKIVLGEFERPEPPAHRTAVATFTDYATTWVATREIKPKTREGS